MCDGYFRAEADNRWLAWVEAQFVKIAEEDQEININVFKVALGVKQVRLELLQCVTRTFSSVIPR